MSDDANKNLIWEKMAERLGHLFTQVRPMADDREVLRMVTHNQRMQRSTQSVAADA